MAATRHLTGRDEFLDLVLADDEFVRAEFEAIVAGFDDPPPRRPARPGPPSCRAARPADEARRPRAHRPVTPERARQRAPPLPAHAVPAAGPLANTQYDAADDGPHDPTGCLPRAARQSPDGAVPAVSRGRLVAFPAHPEPP